MLKVGVSVNTVRCMRPLRYKTEPEVRKEGDNHRIDAEIGNPGRERTLPILPYSNTEFQVSKNSKFSISLPVC